MNMDFLWEHERGDLPYYLRDCNRTYEQFSELIQLRLRVEIFVEVCMISLFSTFPAHLHLELLCCAEIGHENGQFESSGVSVVGMGG